jgi:hypothetical protein
MNLSLPAGPDARRRPSHLKGFLRLLPFLLAAMGLVLIALDGLIFREQFNEIPPHVEYGFTDMGRDLMPVFYEIMRWGFKHEDKLNAASATK